MVLVVPVDVVVNFYLCRVCRFKWCVCVSLVVGGVRSVLSRLLLVVLLGIASGVSVCM